MLLEKWKTIKLFNASFGELKKSTMMKELPRCAGLYIRQPE